MYGIMILTLLAVIFYPASGWLMPIMIVAFIWTVVFPSPRTRVRRFIIRNHFNGR